MDKRKYLKRYKKDYAELRIILNEWDFLEVVSHGIDNEYEDLINPILNLLSLNASKVELEDKITNIISSRYGLSPADTDMNVSKMILEWWKNK